jgi:copper homeostasis protein
LAEGSNYFCYKKKHYAMLFEICAASMPSAQAAFAGGAARVELCSALESGGITPSPALIRICCRDLSIPVNVLIRPREGHFRYTAAEVDLMCEDIRFCREAGANGVVIGALDDRLRPDRPALEAMCAAAGDMDRCFHRAIDFVPDPFAALDLLIELGFRHVLSSGQAANAWEGRHRLHDMIAYAAGRIGVMPGAGIHAGNIREIVQATGATEFHFSGKRREEGPEMPGSIPGLDPAYMVSDAAIIRGVIAAGQGLV